MAKESEYSKAVKEWVLKNVPRTLRKYFDSQTLQFEVPVSLYNYHTTMDAIYEKLISTSIETPYGRERWVMCILTAESIQEEEDHVIVLLADVAVF